MAHTSLSHGEHTQTDRAFQLIKESVWVDLAAGCMRGGRGGRGSDLYYWWQWLHNFSMQDCFQNMTCIWAIYPYRQAYNLGVHVVKSYMTIARSIHTLHPSEPISKHLYVRFSFCAAIFLLNTNWHLLQNIGGWISGQSLDTSKWKQFLSEACALVCTRVAF